MTTIQILQSAEQSGILKSMLSKGLISPTVIHQREIYYKVLVYINSKSPCMTTSEAVSHTATDLKVSESRVWRAWSAMTK